MAASAIEIPIFASHDSSIQTQLNNSQAQLKTLTGFVWLSVDEQTLLEPLVETIIPTDSTGVGAKEAGVIYFIDRQLSGEYGFSGNMFMDAPHISTGITNGTTITVKPSAAWTFLQNTAQTAYLPSGGGGTYAPISYTGATRNYTAGPLSGGTPYQIKYGTTASPRVGSGINYQYPVNMREFWRISLAALQKYSNAAYGGNFQSLSSANQINLVTDIWANKPKTNYHTTDDLTGFSNILPSDFAYELTFLTWAGFLMDPMYGGNQNMVGWDYVGFNGVNFGNFYGEGLSQKTLMVASSATKLKPASLAQYQKQLSGGA